MNERVLLAEPPMLDGARAIRQALRLLRRHIVLFLTVALVVALLGVAVMMLLKPSYMATATVAITTQNADPLAASAQPPAERVEDDVPATEAAMLMSRDVAAAVLRQLPPPPATPGFSPSTMLCHAGIGFFCPRPVTTPVDPEQQFQQQIDGLLASLTVVPELHSRVIDVNATASTGDRAAAIANAVVTNYQRRALAAQTADVNRVAQWLDARTDQLRQRWLDAVHAADNFNVTHNLANTGDGTTANPLIDNQIAQIAVSLSQAQARLAAAQARAAALRDAVQHGDARAAVALSQQPLLVSSANALLQLQDTREQLAAQFGSNYPQIKALDRQIRSARANLSAETGAALASIHEDAVSAQTEVRQLNDMLGTLREKAGVQSSPQAEYRSLAQEAQSAREVYETFLEHAKAVVDRAALLQPPVVFVSHASVPSRPSFPNHLKLGAGIAVVALVLASAAVVIRNYFSTGFHGVEHLRAAAQLPLLGAIPMITRRRNQSIARYVLDEPHSRVSEIVRGLAVQLSLLAAKTDAPTAVLITSATPQEGKTTLAMWLGLIVRQGGQSVLVIDSDHRRSALMQPIGTQARPGFTDLLAGRASPRDVIQTDSDTKIDFISAGGAMSHPFGANDIARLRSLIATLKLSYSMIIIDSAPLLAMSDVLAHARVADQTLFVCRWQQTSRQAVMTSLERLRSYGAQISGVVVCMVNQKMEGAIGGDEFNRREIALIDKFYGA